MRWLAIVLVTSVVAGAIACGSLPELIPEEDLVPPSKLEATLSPVAGWNMGAVTSDKVSGEIPLTHAQTMYSNGDMSITAEVTDSGMIARAYANVISGNVEPSGSNRDTKIDIAGIPGLENWDGKERKGLLVLLVANRFVVSLTGSNIADASVLRDFASRLDVTKWAALRNYRPM